MVTPAPVRVIEHQYLARISPKRQIPKVDRAGVIGDEQQRLEIGVVRLITTLREVGRLPFATFQWYLETVHQLYDGAKAFAAPKEADRLAKQRLFARCRP